jgi:hypothetical protein
MRLIALRPLVLLFATALASWSFAFDPIRDPNLLASPQKEKVVRVAGAKVVLADYELLKRDFPSLQGKGQDEIDRWLVDNAGVLSKPQASQSRVNTAVSLEGGEVLAHRPQDYGRSVVVQVTEGLIDIKGAGSLKPYQGSHGNGLASLGEAIREFTYEKMVNKVFQHAGVATETVGTYAVLDLGFDVKHSEGTSSPAGNILRQAHDRARGISSTFSESKSVEIERTLRRYGITSAGAYLNSEDFAMINIQGTKSGAVLDFGGFLVLEQFDKPATHFFGSRVLLHPKKGEFPQPHANLRVPFEIWGHTRSGIADPNRDNPWIYAHELAVSLRQGRATRADAENHLRTMLEPVERQLNAAPPLVVPCNSSIQRLLVPQF